MSSRAAAGRKRLQTAPSTSLSPKSRSKFSRFLSPSHSSLVSPELQQPYIVGTPAAYSFPTPETPQTPQQLTPRRDNRKPSYPYPEAVHATSSRSPPPQHSLPPPPPHKLSDIRTQSNLRSPLPHEQTILAEDFPAPPPLFTTRSNSQPAAQRSTRSPRPLPIISPPQTADYQQRDTPFVSYSLPASHSVESIPDTPKPGLRNRSPYRTPVSPPRSNTTSPLSSTSGTPTAPSFVSFQSRDTDRADTSTIQTSPPQSYLSPSPSSSSATIDNMTRPPPGRPSSISSGSHSSGRDSRSSGRLDNIKPPSLRSGNKRDPGFVFPSGRSRAAPGSPTRFKFKSKKQKEKERAEAARQAQLHPVPIKSANQTPPLPGTSVPRSDWTSSATSSASSSRTPTVYTSSSDGSQGFVFPSSRSRAHPDPAKKLKNGKSGSPTSPETDLNSSSRFMGIPLKKKKKSPNSTPIMTEGRPLSPSYEGDFEYQDGPEIRTNVDNVNPQSQRENRTAPIQRYTKLGTYPLDPYDSVLLECDRQTGELLRQLNGSSTPSFFPYGTNPPATILDLGCGQGHWMLDAAISWKGYGTKVTGVDIVDVSKNLRMLAIKHGVADNITFIKTNFLQKQLPFPNESFDMVRMSCLTLAISFDRWESVLKEVCRVLTVGGRLELIDDHIFFAYGKSPLSPPSSDAASVPRLDISIPSPRMSTISSITPSPSTRPGPSSRSAGTRLRSDDDSELYDLYEDEDGADTATIHETTSPRLPYSPGPSSSGTPSIIQSVNPDAWVELATSSKELEALFEHMLNMRYGIHLCPSEFLVGMMERVFGYSREMDTMHLTLATPQEEDIPATSRSPDPKSPRSPTSPGSGPTFGGNDSLNPLLHSPGLILWPSTFIPMPQRDVETHALKHNRTLLSTKLALVEYAVEIGDEDDIEDEGVKEALWDYENFLQQRFNPPPIVESSSSSVSSGTSSSGVDNDDFDQATISGVSINDRISIFSMSSVTSEGRAAMLEYGSDIQHHFGWRDPGSPSNSSSSRNGQPSITAPLQLPQRQRNQSFGSAVSASPSGSNELSRRDSANSAVTVTSPPNYSRFEPAHVRTFHIYEAIKMEVLQSADSEDSELPYT